MIPDRSGQEYASLPLLYICEQCLNYMGVCRTHQSKCQRFFPPGNEIYRDQLPNSTKTISVWEVDGNLARIYCRNLCLLAKLFMDHKTLYFDVEPFLFYVLTENDERGCHFVGYFSKEKYSSQKYNLACIVTLPCYQGKGFGRFLIDFSTFPVTSLRGARTWSERRRGRLSGLGQLAYDAYWRSALFEYFHEHRGNKYRLWDVAEETGITIHDMVETLKKNEMLAVQNNVVALAIDWPKVDAHWKKAKASKTRIWLDESKLQWTPGIYTPSKPDFACRSPVSPALRSPTLRSPEAPKENRRPKDRHNDEEPRSASTAEKKKRGRPPKNPASRALDFSAAVSTGESDSKQAETTPTTSRSRKKPPSSATQRVPKEHLLTSEESDDDTPPRKGKSGTCKPEMKKGKRDASSSDDDDDDEGPPRRSGGTRGRRATLSVPRGRRSSTKTTQKRAASSARKSAPTSGGRTAAARKRLPPPVMTSTPMTVASKARPLRSKHAEDSDESIIVSSSSSEADDESDEPSSSSGSQSPTENKPPPRATDGRKPPKPLPVARKPLPKAAKSPSKPAGARKPINIMDEDVSSVASSRATSVQTTASGKAVAVMGIDGASSDEESGDEEDAIGGGKDVGSHAAQSVTSRASSVSSGPIPTLLKRREGKPPTGISVAGKKPVRNRSMTGSKKPLRSAATQSYETRPVAVKSDSEDETHGSDAESSFAGQRATRHSLRSRRNASAKGKRRSRKGHSDEEGYSSPSPRPIGDRLPFSKLSAGEPETINMGGEPDTINMGGDPDDPSDAMLLGTPARSPRAPAPAWMNATVASDEETVDTKEEQAPTLRTIPPLAPQQEQAFAPAAQWEEANRLSEQVPNKPHLLQIPPLETGGSKSPSDNVTTPEGIEMPILAPALVPVDSAPLSDDESVDEQDEDDDAPPNLSPKCYIEQAAAIPPDADSGTHSPYNSQTSGAALEPSSLNTSQAESVATALTSETSSPVKMQTSVYPSHTNSEAQPLGAAEGKSDRADDEEQETFADDDVSIANTSLLDRPPKAPARRLQETSMVEDEPSQSQDMNPTKFPSLATPSEPATNVPILSSIPPLGASDATSMDVENRGHGPVESNNVSAENMRSMDNPQSLPSQQQMRSPPNPRSCGAAPMSLTQHGTPQGLNVSSDSAHPPPLQPQHQGLPSDSSSYTGSYASTSAGESGIVGVAPSDFATYPQQLQPYGNQPQRAPSTSATSAFTAVGVSEHLAPSTSRAASTGSVSVTKSQKPVKEKSVKPRTKKTDVCNLLRFSSVYSSTLGFQVRCTNAHWPLQFVLNAWWNGLFSASFDAWMAAHTVPVRLNAAYAIRAVRSDAVRSDAELACRRCWMADWRPLC
ncbi:MOZ/SAS family protein, partial [Aphelenchoides avenae]